MFSQLLSSIDKFFRRIPGIGRAFMVLLLSIPLNVNAQSKAIETSGDILLFALPATALGSTLLKSESKGTWQFTKGFVLNQAVTISLKFATDKKGHLTRVTGLFLPVIPPPPFKVLHLYKGVTDGNTVFPLMPLPLLPNIVE
jgi:hypothetical protein